MQLLSTSQSPLALPSMKSSQDIHVAQPQMSYLEDWALLERDHSSSLSGAIEALEATTLRLPVTGGARVEGMNCLVSELAEVAAQERALLDECGDLLATTAAMEVEESSLRTHLIQLKQDRCWGLDKSMDNRVVAVQSGQQNEIS